MSSSFHYFWVHLHFTDLMAYVVYSFLLVVISLTAEHEHFLMALGMLHTWFLLTVYYSILRIYHKF